jgi:hypothetical protein
MIPKMKKIIITTTGQEIKIPEELQDKLGYRELYLCQKMFNALYKLIIINNI